MIGLGHIIAATQCATCDAIVPPRRMRLLDPQNHRPYCRDCLRWTAGKLGDGSIRYPLAFDDFIAAALDLGDLVDERGDDEMRELHEKLMIAWLTFISGGELPKEFRPKP